MKRTTVSLIVALSFAATPGMAPKARAARHARDAAHTILPSGQASRAVEGVTLESVLGEMDKTAASFKSVVARLEQVQFTKVVNETDTQKGTVYFQRKGNSVEMMVNFTQPQQKYVLFSGTSLQVYQPGIEQVNKYDLSKHRTEVETFLTLGFGGRGHDLEKSFEVTFAGIDMVGGIRSAILELVPRNPQARSAASRILLWIDLTHGVSVQQQFFEPSGDYRLATYSDIKLNQDLPADAFKLKTTGKTKVVAP